jgi:hypothetical protein
MISVTARKTVTLTQLLTWAFFVACQENQNRPLPGGS